MFYSGQKVVCVYDKDIPGDSLTFGEWNSGEALIKDKVYTVDRIMPHTIFPQIIICTLFEVQRIQVFGVLGYNVKRFRPVDERKTDISVFEELLNTIPAKRMNKEMERI